MVATYDEMSKLEQELVDLLEELAEWEAEPEKKSDLDKTVSRRRIEELRNQLRI